MAATVREGSENLTGGEVNSLPPHLIGLGEAKLAENLDPTDLFGAKTRLGRTAYGSTDFASGQAIDGLKFWTRDAGTAYTVVRIGTTFYTWPASAAISSIGIGGTSGQVARMAPLNNVLVVVCDGLTIKKWDGTTWADLGGTPPAEAKYIAIWNSKVWLGGNDAAPQTVYFSATNNPEDYTTAYDAGSITTQDGGGDTIQGLVPNNRTLLVLYRNYVDCITGSTVADFRVDRLSSNRGLCSPTGYCTAGDVAFFASDDAVYMVAGTKISDLSTLKFKAVYQAISDKTKISLAVVGELLLVVDYGADKAYACAYRYNRWSEWTGQAWKLMDTTIDQKLYAAGDGGSTANIHQLVTGTADNSSAIAAVWQTGDLAFGWPDEIKGLAAVRVHAKPSIGTVTITYYVNGSAWGSSNEVTFAATGTNDWAGVDGQAAIRGTYIGLRFAWSGAGTLLGWVAYAEHTVDKGQIPTEW